MHKMFTSLAAVLMVSTLPLCAMTTGDQSAEVVSDITVSTPTPEAVPLPQKMSKQNKITRLEMKAADEATLSALKESASKLTDPHHKTMADVLIAHLDGVIKAYDSYGDEDKKWLTMLHGMVTQGTRKLNSLFKGEASYLMKMKKEEEKKAEKAAATTEKVAVTPAKPAAEKSVVQKMADTVSAAATAVVDAVKPAGEKAVNAGEKAVDATVDAAEKAMDTAEKTMEITKDDAAKAAESKGPMGDVATPVAADAEVKATTDATKPEAA